MEKYTNNRRRPTVFYEQMSMQSDISFIQIKQQEEAFNFQIVPVSGKAKVRFETMAGLPHKEQRIQALVPLIKEGRVLMVEHCWSDNWQGEHEDMMQSFLTQEYDLFPFCEHDDGLDAMCRIADLETGVMITFPARRAKPKVRPNISPSSFVDRLGAYQPY